MKLKKQKTKMQKLLDDNVYNDIIRYFNHKMIFNQLPRQIGVSPSILNSKFMNKLKEDKDFRNSMKQYFPSELF